MKYVEVVADSGNAATVQAIAEKSSAHDFRPGVAGEDGMQQMRLLVADDNLQSLLDGLQQVLGAQSTARILVLAVEASLPKQDEEQRTQEDSATAVREALYEDNNYVLVSGDPIGERLASVAKKKGMLLMGCDKCCYERQIDEKLVAGAAIGCFPDLYKALSGNMPDQIITL